MKGFIEVVTENRCRILVNVNCIEMVSPLSNGCASITTTSCYSKENWRYDQEIVQSYYPTRNTYEEVKAIIEEAMK